MRIKPKDQRFVRSAFLFKHQKLSLKQPNRTELQPETQSGSWNPDPKPNPQVGGEQRTHRPGVQLLGAPGRSRSGPLVEPQDGNQQQQHLLKTDPGRRVTDRMRIRTDQDGPAVLQHRARRRSHGSPRRCFCQTSPREEALPSGSLKQTAPAPDPDHTTHREDCCRGGGSGSEPRGLRVRSRLRSCAGEKPPGREKPVRIRTLTSGHVYQNKTPPAAGSRHRCHPPPKHRRFELIRKHQRHFSAPGSRLPATAELHFPAFG